MAVVRRVCICGLIHTLIYIIELAKKRHFEFNTDALESQTNRIISQWIPSYFTAIHNYVKRFRSPNEYRWNSASTTSAKNILHHENSRNLILEIGSINTVKAKLAFISSGWPRHRENREFGSYFFQTGKIQGILLWHREKFWDTGKIFFCDTGKNLDTGKIFDCDY